MGIELIIGLGVTVANLLAGAGVAIGAPALSIGQTTLGLGAAGLLGAGGSAAGAANPYIAGGFQAASADTYNNALVAGTNLLNGLNLPFVGDVNAN